ncbi:MAG: hypothetical protein ABSH20_25905, partial [Tepidisphaeraceae bacterium]
LALLADVWGRHRGITEDVLSLAGRRAYHAPRLPRLMVSVPEPDDVSADESRRLAPARKSATL